MSARQCCDAGRVRRWGVVLAGGEGRRLRPLTRAICGDERPKQFCPLFGDRSLLDRTLRRAERAIPAEHLMVSLTSAHAPYYSGDSGLDASQRVVQPSDRGTAPPIVHCLLSVQRLDPEALVAILPCDHHYSNDARFAAKLDHAFESAAAHPDHVILLAAKPSHPETEYGWIELGPSKEEARGLYRVLGFREKPQLESARELFAGGSMWNTFVMIGHVRAFLDMARAAIPSVVEVLEDAHPWANTETRIDESIYERLPSVCLSRDVLAHETDRLIVLPLGDVEWSDLGDPTRALAVMQGRRENVRAERKLPIRPSAPMVPRPSSNARSALFANAAAHAAPAG